MLRKYKLKSFFKTILIIVVVLFSLMQEKKISKTNTSHVNIVNNYPFKSDVSNDSFSQIQTIKMDVINNYHFKNNISNDIFDNINTISEFDHLVGVDDYIKHTPEYIHINSVSYKSYMLDGRLDLFEIDGIYFAKDTIKFNNKNMVYIAMSDKKSIEGEWILNENCIIDPYNYKIIYPENAKIRLLSAKRGNKVKDDWICKCEYNQDYTGSAIKKCGFKNYKYIEW
jgi:hypothetical protein